MKNNWREWKIELKFPLQINKLNLLTWQGMSIFYVDLIYLINQIEMFNIISIKVLVFFNLINMGKYYKVIKL